MKQEEKEFYRLRDQFNDCYNWLPMNEVEAFKAWKEDINCSAQEFFRYHDLENMQQWVDDILATEEACETETKLQNYYLDHEPYGDTEAAIS